MRLLLVEDDEADAFLVRELLDEANAAIDACKRCLGYVKTFTTLQGSPPANVMVDDLASVDLDIAALEQGYRRPEGAGYSLDIKIVPKAGFSERILSWRT